MEWHVDHYSVGEGRTEWLEMDLGVHISKGGLKAILKS